MIKVYGIPNCNTIKKTLIWLDDKKVSYVFHNYRKDGVESEKFRQWLEQVPVEMLLNKSSSTWRNLPDDKKKEAINKTGALQLMVDHPTSIKRPVIEDSSGKILAVGFNEKELESRLTGKP